MKNSSSASKKIRKSESSFNKANHPLLKRERSLKRIKGKRVKPRSKGSPRIQARQLWLMRTLIFMEKQKRQNILTHKPILMGIMIVKRITSPELYGALPGAHRKSSFLRMKSIKEKSRSSTLRRVDPSDWKKLTTPTMMTQMKISSLKIQIHCLKTI